ncbi:hypothetical protein FDUTEX481_00427 [Tolypothrix sp. PCC 7601]|nr:hypothetical protein FDUTEX481_00427 [Tolypothrix sp. PCC 7601]
MKLKTRSQLRYPPADGDKKLFVNKCNADNINQFILRDLLEKCYSSINKFSTKLMQIKKYA